jgi:suppressor for copper-sensitivity B
MAMKQIFLAFFFLLSAVGSSIAASSFDHTSNILKAQLVTAEDAVTPDASTLSAGLVIELQDGWKTYWKSPGQVGYPTSVTWEGSENIENIEMLWPAPKRFEAFDIENYGYANAVTHPLKVTLRDPGKSAKINLSVSLLACSDVCVPQDFILAVSVPEGTGIDTASAMIIADAAAKVPAAAQNSDISLTTFSMNKDKSELYLSLSSDTVLVDPVAFVNLGLDAAFGTPETRFSAAGKTAIITLPILALPEELPVPDVTITDATRAVAFAPTLSEAQSPQAQQGLLTVLLLAFIGGLILNVMPCVLPVLSIKFASALKSANQSRARIRAGFLVSALGVLAFMWALAAILMTIRATGGQVGWGLQFQNPYFLGIMVSIMVLFAANLAGLFEINLPQSWSTRMARADGQPGLAGDFATGALAAVMATPCSAPFLGTAVTFALAGSNLDTIAIFTALGAGLALPYVVIAMRPDWIQKFPKPGAWMNTVKIILSMLMAATAIWLASVLASIIGLTGIAVLLIALVVAIALISSAASQFKLAGIAVAVIALAVAPSFTSAPQSAPKDDIWQAFVESDIAGYVDNGQVIFVDVTAAWCLTCKANKALVLDKGDVKAALSSDGVMTMQADWTRPDADILAYLQANGRFGIPFNIVYGPGAPEGIALPELLTQDAVLTALEQAKP